MEGITQFWEGGQISGMAVLSVQFISFLCVVLFPALTKLNGMVNAWFIYMFIKDAACRYVM